MKHQSGIFRTLGNMLEKNEINITDFYHLMTNFNGNIVDDFRKGEEVII